MLGSDLIEHAGAIGAVAEEPVAEEAIILGEEEVRGTPEQPQANDVTPTNEPRTANTRLWHTPNNLDITPNDLPTFETFAEMIRKERAANQKEHIITVGTEAKMLRLNDRDQLTKKLVTEWVSTMRILIAKKTDINHLEWIHEDAQLYIGVRIGAEFSSASKDYSAEWLGWSFSKLASIMIRLWATSSKDNMENSVEAQLKALTPRITGDNAFEHANAWCGQILKVVRDAKERNPDLDWDAERDHVVVNILLDHLKKEDLIFPYLSTKMEESGKPTNVELFISKLMKTCKTVSHSLKVVELCGYKAIPKPLNDKRKDEPFTHQNSTKRQRNPEPHSEKGNAPSKQDGTDRSGPPATICNGCGRRHHGECLMKEHADFNNSSKPWHESEPGKRLFLQGFSCIQGPTKKNGTWGDRAGGGRFETRGDKGGRFSRGRGSGVNRGTPLYAFETTTETPNVLTLPITIYALDTSYRRTVQALIDTGSPGNFINMELHAWLVSQGAKIYDEEKCICSPLNHKVCSCSKNKVNFYISFLQPSSSVSMETNKDKNMYEISASALFLETYELIIGFPSIQDLHLFKNLQGMVPQTSNISYPHTLQHTCSAVQQRDEATNIHTVQNLSILLNGTEEGDDLSELFHKEAPWEINNEGQPTNISLIDLISINGPKNLKERIKSLCLKHINCFSLHVQPEPARVKPFRIGVNVDQWEHPKHCGPPRVQSDIKQEEIKRQLDKLLTLDVIQTSQAPYYSHPHLTKKSDDTWRFCIDYRQLNLCSKSLGWPIPNIELLLRRVGKKNPTYFGKIDLTSGYHQMAVSEDSRRLTAFKTAFGTYEWKRCPFGLKGAPAYFQKAMQTEVLGNLLYNVCEVYLDDILHWGSSADEYLMNLENLFICLSSRRIYLNPKKCSFGLETIEYTGHLLDKEGLTFSKKKIEQVIDFIQPSTQKELRSFLGLANYFRNNIRDHSLLTQPLQELIRNYKPKTKLVWSQENIEVFKKIKSAINSCPKLYFLDDVSPIFLHTDASDYGVGAYLFQVVEGAEHPIMFLSSTFKREQMRWSAADKECYAIVWAFKHLEHLIRDRYFILRTDHKNLTYLNLENSGKIKRWKILIQEFNCGVEHIVGVDNFVADDFSRLIPHMEKSKSIEVEAPIEVLSTLETDLPIPMVNSSLGGSSDDGIYLPRVTTHSDYDLGTSTVVPAAPLIDKPVPRDKFKLISAVHNSVVGHMGVDKTVERLRIQGHNWHGMRSQVITFIQKHCAICQKLSLQKIVTNTKPFTLSSYDVMQRVSVDSTGRLPKDAQNNEYIVSIIDNFSRFLELYAVNDLSANTFARCLLDFIGRYGVPFELISDKGTQFANEIIQELCRAVGTKQVFTMTASKEENGIVERSIREIRRHLRAVIFHTNLMDNWSTYLPIVQRIFNADVKQYLGVSPAQIVFGNSIQLDRGLLFQNNPNKLQTMSEWMQKMLDAQAKIIATARKTLDQRDVFHTSKQPVEITSFPINSYVLVDYIDRPPTSLHTIHEGPFRVVCSEGGRYTLMNLITGDTKECHISRLRPFYYDDEETPRQTAMRDSQQWDVDFIITHAGEKSRRKELKFKVKWLNHDEQFATWEPYSSLRHNSKLHEYCKAHKMKSLIPK